MTALNDTENPHMSRPHVTAQLVGSRLVAILRADTADTFVDTARRLAEEGVTCIEFALTSRGAIAALAEASRQLPCTVSLGAGTVLGPRAAESAMDAGAAFLVSPSVDGAVITAGAERGVPVYAGALTPTEIVAAWRAGAAAVKVFPASLGGPHYVRRLREPLPQIPLIPTGGVTMNSAADYLAAGAIAVGMGGGLAGVKGDLGRLLSDLATAPPAPEPTDVGERP